MSDHSHSYAQKGDLVSLNCVSPSKWYVAWVTDYDWNNGWPKYLLESIDDGELCWWENVGMNVYSRERVAEHPTWLWEDNQFDLYDRWKEVCYGQNDAYIVLPAMPKFEARGSVVLDVRVRFNLSDFRNPKTFQDWAALSNDEMDIYYKESVDKYKKSQLTDQPIVAQAKEDEG